MLDKLGRAVKPGSILMDEDGIYEVQKITDSDADVCEVDIDDAGNVVERSEVWSKTKSEIKKCTVI